MSKIALCIIATGKYKSFLQRIIKDINERFLLNHSITIHLFIDEDYPVLSDPLLGSRSFFRIHKIQPYKFPEATLLRYKIMTSVTYTEDYIFYIDADMGIVDTVGDEILGDIVAVRHPGYIKRECNAWEENKESSAFIPKEKRKHYYAGGFQGGKALQYYFAMMQMREMITDDLSKSIVPKWHDESIWNAWLIRCHPRHINTLHYDYCTPEAKNKRIAWGINDSKPKILALEKNFKEIRS